LCFFSRPHWVILPPVHSALMPPNATLRPCMTGRKAGAEPRSHLLTLSHSSAHPPHSVLIPDLYQGEVALDVAEAQHLSGNLSWPLAVAQITEAVDYLRGSGSPKVGVIGFWCEWEAAAKLPWGGGLWSQCHPVGACGWF
jgi:hypothetical protein